MTKDGPTLLYRRDPARRMARFYRLQLQPTLFGEFSVQREWGRIGQSGTCRREEFATLEDATAWLERLRKTKLGRGYVDKTAAF